jgi:4-amino-4-deoxychorismate lyase
VSNLLSFHLNGVEAAAAPAGSRALHYGDGVFRTMLRHRGELLYADAQIDKLLADAKGIGLGVEAGLHHQLHDELSSIAMDFQTIVLKVMLVRGGQGRGYSPVEEIIDRYVYAYTAPNYPGTAWSEGVAVTRATVALAEQPLLAGIKHLNRLEQVLAYRSAPAQVQEVILCDAGGNAICGGRSNLFIVEDSVLQTPDLKSCGVSGLMRDRVMAVARTLGIECRIGTIPWTLVEQAEELFVTNSVIGIWPVRQLLAREAKAPGVITQRLMSTLNHPRLS